ncbi:hypothetical protein, partial [Corallococcus sp. AB049A]|uniref:hypothetical protein n=1 Tax=Corallococcus sp. AB049A TaxID=2316721 RepID=UPI0018F71792
MDNESQPFISATAPSTTTGEEKGYISLSAHHRNSRAKEEDIREEGREGEEEEEGREEGREGEDDEEEGGRGEEGVEGGGGEEEETNIEIIQLPNDSEEP